MTRLISHTRSGKQRPPTFDGERSRGLESRLLGSISGEVQFDRLTRGLYSTDASIYEAPPTGVVCPRSVEDIRRTIEIAGEFDVSLVPRGAGTSQSGQSIGAGLIVDTSRHLNRVLDFDADRRRVVVEPGIVLDELNAFLRPHGLFFPIDVATSSRATLGGMAGNNSAGARSIRYGHMVEHVRAIGTVMADGREASFGQGGELPTKSRIDAMRPAPDRLAVALQALYEREAEELEHRLPKVPRHVAGYALQRLGGGKPRLSDLLVGSEGTLAFFTALELDLQPIPPVRALAVCAFGSIRAALTAVPTIVDAEPTAIELVDRTLLGLASDIPTFRSTLERLAGDGDGALGDLLVVEFAGDDLQPVRHSLRMLEDAVAGSATRIVRAESLDLQRRIWGLRKAGLNISMSMKDARKPLAFIEDCTIPLARLPEWHEKLSAIIERHSTHAVWYAHASVGCLHVRPALDLNDGGDIVRLRAIAEETFALASELGGSHSGEHGDGWIRSEFLEPMLGARLVRAFEEIKRQFDPNARFNPGKIVHPPRMDDPTLLRSRDSANRRRLPTRLDWESWGGFDQAVDMCNNNGTCRKRDAGVMCPSFRATGDERDSTRGRANALRLALSGQLGNVGWDSPDLYRAMDLCIGCKGCRRECPTGVDMARMKIEYLARYRTRHPLTARERALAFLPRIAPLASRFPRLLNTRNERRWLAELGDRALGLAAERALPTWAPRRFRWPSTTPSPAGKFRGEVILLVDTFTRYFEPANAYAAIRVLATSGYRVRSPAHSGRPLCCGRTFLNGGLIDRAGAELERMTRALTPFAERGVPIVGLEPSCLLTLRDELPALCPSETNTSISNSAMLFSELLTRDTALDGLPMSPLPVSRVRIHGHCHEKAFGLEAKTAELLREIPDLAVDSISAGCCGMAGSFGYESEHASISRRIAELELLPTVEEMGDDEWLVANGTSCRHQVADLTDREARHVAVALDASLVHV